KKTAESLASLKEAVGYGFADLKLMNSDEDLVAVRELPEFAAFVEDTKKAIKELNAKEVAKLMETHEPFEFNFELDDINGKKVSKAEFAGKVMIVDIWGTWCPPCRAEIPHFVELDKEFKEKGLQIVGLNREQTKDDEAAVKLVKDFNEQQGVTYPCALITEEIMGQVPEFQGFPTTLFIDRAGKVRLKVVGARGPEFLQAVVEL
ncbi:MAG: TlpA disulfide reductase family protein, partial [Planctomycetota bacterium]|nr:TlpA disulfide reductase family protein [Planctomycetota bacterium]